MAKKATCLQQTEMYLLLQGQTIDDIPMGVIEDAAQLCKANSIQVSNMR